MITNVLMAYLMQINNKLSEKLSKFDLDQVLSKIQEEQQQEVENLFDLKFNPKYFNDLDNKFVNVETNKNYISKRNLFLKTYSKYQNIDLSLIENLEDLKSEEINGKIIFIFIELIDSIVRTNYFLHKEYISIKISASKVVEKNIYKYLFQPLFETFVYSEQFEAIHIRDSKISRGGIRHSLRTDYRNEVLNLQQTQNLKNTIIIPTGAKGGFFIKKNNETNDKVLIVQCYQNFIRALLDITDNLSQDNIKTASSSKIFINKNIVRYDDEDYYLVVAADKGTGDFSDFANEISLIYNFWLQDAFASGGKHGYSHKELGITAKGALECMEQHLIDLKLKSPKDHQGDGQILEVFCFGNMSGDVAGNGLLYSKNFKLLAAVDSQYIFINPNPNIDADFQERQRLFDEKGKWNDFNSQIISSGGGVFSKKEEKIILSKEIREKFSIAEIEISPNNLIKKIMSFDYDIFWSGAIGTIIKSSLEDNHYIADKNSEAIRINAKDLKSKIFCEGANLSITEAGRLEYSLNGGMIYSDFIDNSAGVNCSDYEVNIKIALNISNLKNEEKYQLIKDMREEVCDLVLKNNKIQAGIISNEFKASKDKIAEHFELISYFKNKPNFHLILKNFPSLQELEERAKTLNIGLTKPELSILLSLSKIEMKQNLLNSSDFKDSQFDIHIENYFPSILNNAKYKHLILNHPLRKEIIVTQICNKITKIGS